MTDVAALFDRVVALIRSAAQQLTDVATREGSAGAPPGLD